MENKKRSRIRLPTIIAGAVLAATTSIAMALAYHRYTHTYDVLEKRWYADGSITGTTETLRSVSQMDSLLNWTEIQLGGRDLVRIALYRCSPFQTLIIWDEGDGIVDEIGAVPYNHEGGGHILEGHIVYFREEHYETMKDLFDKRDKELREQLKRFGLEDVLKTQ